MASQVTQNPREPRDHEGDRKKRRDTFGDRKFGDLDGARRAPDDYPTREGRTWLNGAKPHPPAAPSSQEWDYGFQPTKYGRGK